MRFFTQRGFATFVGVLLLGAFVAAMGQEVERPRKGGKNKGKRAQREAEAAVKSALPTELTQHFPIGREFKGVAIPSYDGDRLKSVMNADSVTRVDEQFLDLMNLVVHVYNSEGKPETTITMDEAAYDLVAGELASKTPSKIEQPRFTMTGDKMIYQTESQVARMVGNVVVIVPDAKDMAPDFGFPGTVPAAKKTP
ncbi:MAG: LPS export ABC transporter periplasmic protein LptC [Verrucomicrobiales bacterium]|nr:LPS export ABC transporter periplasmic protein LptC [Verrucomicrobiales bacterium]